jgi:folate-dependent phosphoribosylglycinamide formyltransferase PurN
VKIVFLAVDDEFAGSMQRYVYETHPAWVVGSVISTCPIYKKSKVGATLFVLRRSGLRYGLEMFRMKIVRKMMEKKDKVNPSQLARQHNVGMLYTADINSDESIKQLAAWQPDLIISTNFSHYVGPRVRSLARVGAWNLHKSYLPHYRGMAPSFYALLNGEKQVGVTLHQLSKGIDVGDIVRQVAVPIEAGESVYSLNRKTSDVGGRMLAALLNEGNVDGIKLSPQPSGIWPNHSYPTRSDVRAFLRKGLEF